MNSEDNPGQSVAIARAADLTRHAREARDRGNLGEAVADLQAAAVVYAAVEEPDEAITRARADCCRTLAETLIEADRLPEAMQAYQEAVDAYGRLPDAEADARECARLIVLGVRGLFRRPEERLDLLIARYDRDLRQLAAREGAEAERAAMLFQLGTILQRRDRFTPSAERYTAALDLYARLPGEELQVASCHFRLAGLYHHELDQPARARRHYEDAIRLFALHEPLADGEQTNRVLCEMLLRGLDEPGPGGA